MAADTELPVQALVTFNVLSWEIQRWSCIYCQYASPLRSLFLDHIQRHAPPKRLKRDKTTSTEDSNYFSRTSSSSSSTSSHSSVPNLPLDINSSNHVKDCCLSPEDRDIDVITVKDDVDNGHYTPQSTTGTNFRLSTSTSTYNSQNSLHDLSDSLRNSVIHGNDHVQDAQGIVSPTNVTHQASHRSKSDNHEVEVQPTDLSKNGGLENCNGPVGKNSDLHHQRISQSHPNILTRLLNRPPPIVLPVDTPSTTAELNPSVPLDMTSTSTSSTTNKAELIKQDAVEEPDDRDMDEISENAMTKSAMLSPLFGARVYRCNVCEYRSDRLDDLRRHIRCHTNDNCQQPGSHGKKDEGNENDKETEFNQDVLSDQAPPVEQSYICSECGFVTVSKCEFESHKLKHSEDEDFECYLCSFRTSTLPDLQNHLQERHDQHAVDMVPKRKQNSTDADEEFSSDEEDIAQNMPKRQRLSRSFSSDSGSEYNNDVNHRESISTGSPDDRREPPPLVSTTDPYKLDLKHHIPETPTSYRKIIHEAFERNLREYNNNNDIDKSPGPPRSASPVGSFMKGIPQLRHSLSDEPRERKDHPVPRTDLSVPLSVSIAQQQSMMMATGQFFGFPGDPRLASPAFMSPTMLRPAFEFPRIAPPTTVGTGLLIPRTPVSPCQPSPTALSQVPSTSSQISQGMKASHAQALAEEERLLAEKSPRSFNRCRICKFETYNRKLYRDHLQECYKNRLRLGKKMHKCQMCSYMTSRLGNLKRHEWTVHKKPKPPRIRSPRLSLQLPEMGSPPLEEARSLDHA